METRSRGKQKKKKIIILLHLKQGHIHIYKVVAVG